MHFFFSRNTNSIIMFSTRRKYRSELHRYCDASLCIRSSSENGTDS